MLIVLTFIVIGFVVAACVQEGVFTAVCTLINVVLSGMIAFWAFEPLADLLEAAFVGTVAEGFEDCICLTALFLLAFGLLRLVTNSLSYTVPDYADYVNRGGALVAGVLAGYLLAGFLVVTVQTLPFPRDMEMFDTRVDPKADNAFVRSRLPPDRVWLALMRRAGDRSFGWEGHSTFDKHGNFLVRYYRYHRKDKDGKLVPYDGGTPTK
jgi:hypothetical protein